MRGFLGSYGSFSADLNLVIQVAMGIGLLVGALLARAKRYRAHGICQVAVLSLNLLLITTIMWPTFHTQILPSLPKRLSKPHYAIATAHGVLGALAELLGVYIALVAGSNILPQSWRFERWKLWMRLELALWWIVLVTGIATYFIWCVPVLAMRNLRPPLPFSPNFALYRFLVVVIALLA
jgi:uncharacterized membrane protein YozB (DUF420 family)